MVEQNKVLVERLKALKEKSGMTSAQIAEKSRIPESTVTRIFMGKTQNPTIITVMAMTKAMGGTAADIFDDDAQVIPAESALVSEADRKHNEVVELYREIIASKNRWIRTLAGILIAFAAIILIVLFIDLFNGHIGYFRY